MIENQGGINYFEKIDSTNLYLLEYKGEVRDFTTVYSLNQQKGRGRLGRNWEEIENDSLAVSIVVNLPVEKLPPMPLLGGLVVGKTLKNLYDINADLKWSNDVLVRNKKLAGILCESRIFKENARLVFGVGINLRQSQLFFDERNLCYGTSLKILGINNIDVGVLVVEIVNMFKSYFHKYLDQGFEKDLLLEYEKNCITIGKNILIEKGTQRLKGFAKSVNFDGGLCCEINGVDEIVYGGEVSVRGLYGYND